MTMGEFQQKSCRVDGSRLTCEPQKNGTFAMVKASDELGYGHAPIIVGFLIMGDGYILKSKPIDGLVAITLYGSLWKNHPAVGL